MEGGTGKAKVTPPYYYIKLFHKAQQRLNTEPQGIPEALDGAVPWQIEFRIARQFQNILP